MHQTLTYSDNSLKKVRKTYKTQLNAWKCCCSAKLKCNKTVQVVCTNIQN